MLVLSRKVGESIEMTSGEVVMNLTLLQIKGDRIRLGLSAPKDVKILRSELTKIDVATSPTEEAA